MCSTFYIVCFPCWVAVFLSGANFETSVNGTPVGLNDGNCYDPFEGFKMLLLAAFLGLNGNLKTLPWS